MELATMVLRGWTGSEVTLFQDKRLRPYARFRLAVPRARRNDKGEWEELEGSWYTVKAWGKLALNIGLAVRKGQPVVVVGRPASQAWINKDGEAASELVVHASTIGHDLANGVASFSKLIRTPPSEPGEVGAVADETPAPPSDQFDQVPPQPTPPVPEPAPTGRPGNEKGGSAPPEGPNPLTPQMAQPASGLSPF